MGDARRSAVDLLLFLVVSVLLAILACLTYDYAFGADGPVYSQSAPPAVGDPCTSRPPVVDLDDGRVYLCESNVWKVRDLPECNASPPTSPACGSNSRPVCILTSTDPPQLWGCNSSNAWTQIGGGTGGAPTNATYITQTLNGTLTNEQSLGELGTGLMKNTTTTGTGVVSIYGGATCTNQFPRSLSASGVPTCASVDLSLDTASTRLPLSKFTDDDTTSGKVLTSGGAGGEPSWLDGGDIGRVGTCISGSCFQLGAYDADGSGDSQILCWTDSGEDNQFCINSSAWSVSTDVEVSPPAAGTVLCAKGDSGCGGYGIGLDTDQNGTNAYISRDGASGEVRVDPDADGALAFTMTETGSNSYLVWATGSCSPNQACSGSQKWCNPGDGSLCWCDASGSGLWNCGMAKSLNAQDTDGDSTSTIEVYGPFSNRATSANQFEFDADGDELWDVALVEDGSANSGLSLRNGLGFIQFGTEARLKVKLCGVNQDAGFFYDENDDGAFDAADDFCWGLGGYDEDCDCAADAFGDMLSSTFDQDSDGTVDYADGAPAQIQVDIDNDGTREISLADGKLTVDPDENGTANMVIGSDVPAHNEVYTWDGTNSVAVWATAGSGSGDVTDVYGCASGDCNDIAVADGEQLDFSAVNNSATTEGLVLPQGTSVLTGTATGQIGFDTTDGRGALYVGQQVNGLALAVPVNVQSPEYVYLFTEAIAYTASAVMFFPFYIPEGTFASALLADADPQTDSSGIGYSMSCLTGTSAGNECAVGMASAANTTTQSYEPRKMRIFGVRGSSITVTSNRQTRKLAVGGVRTGTDGNPYTKTDGMYFWCDMAADLDNDGTVGDIDSDGTGTTHPDGDCGDASEDADDCNWYAVTMNNATDDSNGKLAAATSTTATNTGVSCAVTAYQTLEIAYDGTTAAFYIDGASEASHTTNIPASGRRLWNWGVYIDQNIAAAKAWYIDWMRYYGLR